MKRASLLCFLLLLLCNCRSYSQNQESDTFTDSLTYYNFALITIRHVSERYERTEINLIYRKENKIKIHSIVKEPSLSVDTIYTLNGSQIMLIDKFASDFKSNNITSDKVVIAGSKTYFEMMLDGEKYQIENKVDYSLFWDLFNNE